MPGVIRVAQETVCSDLTGDTCGTRRRQAPEDTLLLTSHDQCDPSDRAERAGTSDNCQCCHGIGASFSSLPRSLALDAFAEAKDAHSHQEMRPRLARCRRADPVDRSDVEVRCRIPPQPFLLTEADLIPVPLSWSPNNASFKPYDLAFIALARSCSLPSVITPQDRRHLALILEYLDNLVEARHRDAVDHELKGNPPPGLGSDVAAHGARLEQ